MERSMSKKKISVLNVDIKSNSFTNGWHSACGGIGWEWKCPDCGETLQWAPHGWWKIECCRMWKMKMVAEGRRVNE